MLVDSNVISEVWKTHGSPQVKASFAALGNETRFSTIVFGELYSGILRLEDGRRKSSLLRNYDVMRRTYGAAALGVTTEVAETWARLQVSLRKIGHPRPIADTLIAATALAHDLTLMTRNVRDFEDTGVRLFNPWED